MNRHKLQESIAQNRHFTQSRKVSLYSNFSRLEDTNPDGYEANISAWKEVLEDALQNGSFADASCIEAGPELIADLSDAQNGTPLSLHCVIDRMLAENSIVPLARFRAMYPGTARTGLFSISAKTVGWLFGSILPQRGYSSKDPRGDGNELRQEKYVSMKAVAKGSRLVVQKLNEFADKQGNNLLSKTFNAAQVMEIIGEEYSKLDIECFLAYSASHNMIHFSKDADVIKLISAGSITEIDRTITSLRTQINELTKREAALDSKIKDYEQKARAAVKTNRKMAKSLLQKKLSLEKSHDNTLGSLDQLESILHKIDEASDNKQAFEALQSSSSVLAELNKDVSLDDVENLVERLQDAVADTDEVASGLADLNINESAADREVEDMELDNELEQLEEEETAKNVATKFPSVPQHKPVSDIKRENDQEIQEHDHASTEKAKAIPN